MQLDLPVRNALLLACVGSLALNGCGGGDNGPAIEANTQTIHFDTAPTLNKGGSASVVARASSGLAVRYGSVTPAVCSVDASSGLVTSLTLGNCVVSANQAGSSKYAQAPEVTLTLPVVFSPEQSIAFAAAPSLSLGGTAVVSANATSGLPVSFSSLSAAICSVLPDTGVATGLLPGNCVIAANQPGDTNYHAAPQVTQTIVVSAPTGMRAPGTPDSVTAAPGAVAGTVVVGFGGTDSGGSPITGYTVTSQPAGISATGTASPITVPCPNTCRGYTLSVSAQNAVGSGSPSAAVPVTASYRVVETFHEPDTQPNDSIFIGSFTFNFTTGAVSDLKGILSESMTGGSTGYPNDNMRWLALDYQLVSWHDTTLGGTFVASFRNNDTSTFLSGSAGDGWSPQQGVSVGGRYSGSPGANPGNAYALIFVPDDPTAALTSAQLIKLAYADCAPGGMMGDTCMTGTAFAGYGSDGTMGGVPLSQRITRN